LFSGLFVSQLAASERAERQERYQEQTHPMCLQKGYGIERLRFRAALASALVGRLTKAGECKYPPSGAYSISSSARTRKSRLIISPMVRAVVRLTTSSNFTGCSMGKSAGFAPFNTFCTYPTSRLAS